MTITPLLRYTVSRVESSVSEENCVRANIGHFFHCVFSTSQVRFRNDQKNRTEWRNVIHVTRSSYEVIEFIDSFIEGQ